MITRCLNPRWQCLNPTWQNSKWLPSLIWVRMNEWSFFVQMVVREMWVSSFCANGGNHSWQVCVSLRGKTKMAESKMAKLKMSAIIKLSQNEWVKFYCANGGNQSWQVWVTLRGKTKMAESKMVEFKLAEFKMVAIIKLGENEWVWVRLN